MVYKCRAAASFASENQGNLCEGFGRAVCRCGFVFCLLWALDLVAAPAVSWLGNTFPGGGKSVQNNMAALWVSPDGNCYTSSFWDEAGREAGIYQDGEPIGSCADTHTHGGFAVAGDGTYIYLACAAGQNRNGVRRYDRLGKLAPVAGHEGDGGFVELTNSPGSIRGLTVMRDGTVLATDYEANVVHRLNGADLSLARRFTVDRPGRIAVAKNDSIWIACGSPAKVKHFSHDGSAMNQEIEGVGDPAALAFDRAGHLLVADDGPDQQVKIFDVSGEPKSIGTLGERGGIFAGRRGMTGPLRFNGLTGIGCDALGNIYVSSNGLGPHYRDHPGFGAELKCFTPDGKLHWQVQGLEFVDTAAIDPNSETDCYTKDEHHVLDFSQTLPGKEWSYRGFTIDRFRYPDDPRLHVSAECVLGVRNLAGRKYLYLSDMYGKFVIVYRLEKNSEIAVPCAMFGREHLKEGWPAGQPREGAWLWRDLNGDGKMGPFEFEENKTDNPFVWGWSVDANGTVWKANRENGLRKFPVKGFDIFGTPMYSYADSTLEANPEPFVETPQFKGDVNRVEYDAANDVMYLSGYTAKHPNRPEMWGLVGTVVCRYEHWSLGNRQPAWELELPYDATVQDKLLPKSMAIAGDYLFVTYQRQAKILVYDVKTTKLVDTLAPGMNVGWVDVPYGISAFRRSNGEYVVFCEDVLNARITMYRWKPSLNGQSKLR